MSDRCFVKILIGGNIPRSLLTELAAQLEAEGLRAIDDGISYNSVADYMDAFFAANGRGMIGFESDDVSGGHFEALVEFLEKHKIDYKEINDALPGVYDAQMTVYRDGKKLVCATDSNDMVYVPLNALQTALCDRQVDQLVELYTNAEKPLPPITITD